MPIITGAASLVGDIGSLQYNGVQFNILRYTKVNHKALQDEAKWTTKYVEATLEVQATITLNPGDQTTDLTLQQVRILLSQHAGNLIYAGNGFGPFNINPPGGGGLRDVAYGPVPELLFFQGLGAGRGAQVEWRVTTRIPEIKVAAVLGGGGGLPHPLQYNYEAELTYDDLGYALIRIAGTIEVPATRTTQDNRKLPNHVDFYRSRWMNIQIDLTKYKPPRRTFRYSRDKRTCEFEYVAEQLPRFGLPPGCTDARGQMTVAPVKTGRQKWANAFSQWQCSLRCTYAVSPQFEARMASWDFYQLLQYRMNYSANGKFAPIKSKSNKDQQPTPLDVVKRILGFEVRNAFIGPLTNAGATVIANLFGKQQAASPSVNKTRALLADWRFSEGVYLDSKTVTFEASWYLFTTFATIFAATGPWRYPAGHDKKTWAASMGKLMGWAGTLANNLDPTVDLIVDVGGGVPGTVNDGLPAVAE